MEAPTTANGHGPDNVTVLAPLSYGAQLRDLAAKREQQRAGTVTLPQASAEMGQPVIFQLRALTMKEMRRLGTMPDPLAETINAFNDELSVYAAKQMGAKGQQTAADDLERQALIAYFEESGSWAFQEFQDAVRDATVLMCCTEPRVVLEEAFVADLAHEVALSWITEEDRSAIQAEVARVTGELAMRDLKSDLAAREDRAGAAAAGVPAEHDLRDGAEPDVRPQRPRRRAR